MQIPGAWGAIVRDAANEVLREMGTRWARVIYLRHTASYPGFGIQSKNKTKMPKMGQN